MAFSVLATPQLIHPAYNPSQFWVYDDINNVLGFRYVFKLGTPTQTFNTIKVAPQPDGKGFFDASKYLQNLVSNNIPQKNIGQGFDNSNWKFADEGNVKSYIVGYGIEHIQFNLFDSIQNDNGLIRINIIPTTTGGLPPYHSFVVGDTIEIINTTNLNLLSFRTVVSTDSSTWITIDQNWSSLTGFTASGTIYYADRRLTATDPGQLGFTIRQCYNEALSFQKFPSFDTNRIQLLPNPAEPDLQRILTNFPRTGGTIKPYQNMFWNFMHRQGEGVNCIFFQNDAGELFRMNTNSPDNGSHFVKQVNVSPDANIIPVGSSTFPLVKNNTKYYEVWAESSCCAEFCETLDVNITVAGSTSPVVIDGEYTFVANNIGTEEEPIWQYEGSFDNGVTTFTAYIRRSLDLPNTWEHYTINPLTFEEVVFAVQNDANCWNFSYCLEIPCMHLNMTFVMGGESYTKTFQPTGYDEVNNKFIYGGFFNATPSQQGFIYPPNSGSGQISYDFFANIGRIEWNPTSERWEYINWLEGPTYEEFVVAYTEEDLCDEVVWTIPAPDCGSNEPKKLFARIDGNLVTFRLHTATLNGQRTYVGIYVEGGVTVYTIWLYYDNSDGWTFSYGSTLVGSTPLFTLPSTVGSPEDCPIDSTWDDLNVGVFDNFETYDYYEGISSTTSSGQDCGSVEAQNDGNGNFIFELTNQYLPGWTGTYQVRPNFTNTDWVLENLVGNTIIGRTPKTGDIPPLSTSFVMDGEPDIITEFYSDFRCYDPNICPNDVSYEYILSPNVYPVITTQSSCSEEEQTRTSEKIRINIDQTCQQNNIQLLFQDRSGSWSSFAFPLRVEETGTLEKKSYRQKIGGLRPNGYAYETFENEKPIYHSSVEKQYKLSTNWLTDEMSLYFEELLSSPNVYVNFGNYNEDYFPTSNPWLACEIVDTSFKTERKQNKNLIRREVTIKLNSKDTINI